MGARVTRALAARPRPTLGMSRGLSPLPRRKFGLPVADFRLLEIPP